MFVVRRSSFGSFVVRSFFLPSFVVRSFVRLFVRSSLASTSFTVISNNDEQRAHDLVAVCGGVAIFRSFCRFVAWRWWSCDLLRGSFLSSTLDSPAVRYLRLIGRVALFRVDCTANTNISLVGNNCTASYAYVAEHRDGERRSERAGYQYIQGAIIMINSYCSARREHGASSGNISIVLSKCEHLHGRFRTSALPH